MTRMILASPPNRCPPDLILHAQYRRGRTFRGLLELPYPISLHLVISKAPLSLEIRISRQTTANHALLLLLCLGYPMKDLLHTLLLKIFSEDQEVHPRWRKVLHVQVHRDWLGWNRIRGRDHGQKESVRL